MIALFRPLRILFVVWSVTAIADGAEPNTDPVLRRRIPASAIVRVAPQATVAPTVTAAAPITEAVAAANLRRKVTVQFDPRTIGAVTKPVVVTGGVVAATTTAADGKISVNMEAGRLTFVKSDATTAPAKMEEDEFLLSSRVFVPVTKPGTDEIEAVVECVPYVRPNPASVSWDEASGRYLTTAQIGLRSTAADRSSFPLPEPVTVSLEFEGIESPDAATELPGPVRLKSVGIAGEARVRLVFVATNLHPRLRVRADFGEQLAELALVPALRVQPQEQEVHGLGLGDITLVVRRALRGRTREFELDPRGLPTPIFTVAAGDLKLPGSLPGENGLFFARSSGLGVARIEISAEGESVEAIVNQVFPWLPVGFALAGGAVGGFARRFRRARATPAKVDGRRVGEGTIVGFVIFVLAAFGIRLIPQLPTEIVGSAMGAFLTAFVGGFFGVMLLEGMRPPRESREEAKPDPAGE